MWDNLSIKDKAKYIEFAVKNGYKDLDIIKDAYNKFANGGPKEDNKIGPTYNPETKRWTNYKGQDITGKSFKGKYGTTTYLNSGAVDLDASEASGKDNDHHWRYASNAPRVYIGGTANETRQKYYEKDIELTNTIKQIAKQYGISPNVLASRIADEGPIDDNIRHYNNSNGYIRRGDMVGPAWGLDDLGTMIYEGAIELRPELRKQINIDHEFENEHGRTTYSVDSKNFLDGVEITAVALKYFKDEMRKRYPKATEEQLEQYATAAFNNGLTGATNLINKGRLKEAYKPYINIKGDGGFINPYPAGHRYTESPECAYFSNHTLNDQGYMMSGNAWTPRGGDIIFNGFDGLEKPDTYDEDSYNKYALDAADNVFNDFNTRKTLDPNKVYTVNMYHASSRKKERAFNEGDSVYGTHTGYLNYEPEDDTWYVTHNIDGVVHKDRFGDLQRKGNSNRVTAIFEPRKNTVLNRALTWLGFANGGMLNIMPSPEDID